LGPSSPSCATFMTNVFTVQPELNSSEPRLHTRAAVESQYRRSGDWTCSKIRADEANHRGPLHYAWYCGRGDQPSQLREIPKIMTLILRRYTLDRETSRCLRHLDGEKIIATILPNVAKQDARFPTAPLIEDDQSSSSWDSSFESQRSESSCLILISTRCCNRDS
jgi:hypothetical protein